MKAVMGLLRFQSSVGNPVGYETEDGTLVDVKLPNAASSENLPKPAFDRLYLVTMAGLPEFRSVYDALSKMCFYNLSSEQMRLPHAADSSPVLRRDGSNLASVAGRLFDESPELKRRLLEHLAAVAPEVVDVRCSSLDGFDYLDFQMLGVDPPWLRSNCVSDGTLRVLGNLIASMQFVGYGNLLSLIAIEGPETAIHPAASTASMEALREASLQTQIVITSHSPNLLDALDPEFDKLLVAQIREGRTEIDAVDLVGASAIRDHLFSAGELLRVDQLSPRISVFNGANATTSADPRP